MTLTRCCVAGLLFVCMTGLFAQAQSQTPTSESNILDRLKDPANAKQLQQALEILQRVANTKAENTKGGEGHKTVGDTLDKGLDMAKSAVVYLAARIEQVAPQLWRVLVVQQYVKGAVSLINPAGFLLLIWLYRHFLLKWWKPQPGDDDAKELAFKEINNPQEWPLQPTHKGWRGGLSIALPLACMVIGFLWFFSAISEAAGYFINPNYYALKDIIALARNPGAF